MRTFRCHSFIPNCTLRYSGLNSNHLPGNSLVHLDLQGSTALSALSDATGPVVNANRKRAADSSAVKPKRTRKRAWRGNAAVLSASEHPLVDPSSSSHITVAGPSVPAPPSTPIRPAPMLHFGSINHAIRSSRKPSSEIDASDVWFHIIYLKDSAQPAMVPDQECLRCRPDTEDYSYVACRLCM